MKKYPSKHCKTKKRSKIKITSSQSKTVKHIGGAQNTIKPTYENFVKLTDSTDSYGKLPETNDFFRKIVGIIRQVNNTSNHNEVVSLKKKFLDIFTDDKNNDTEPNNRSQIFPNNKIRPHLKNRQLKQN